MALRVFGEDTLRQALPLQPQPRRSEVTTVAPWAPGATLVQAENLKAEAGTQTRAAGKLGTRRCDHPQEKQGGVTTRRSDEEQGGVTTRKRNKEEQGGVTTHRSEKEKRRYDHPQE